MAKIKIIPGSGRQEVYRSGEWSIVREAGYGFRCNALSVSWYVEKSDKPYSSFRRFKEAKEFIEKRPS